jgi:putative FmdB family regulatory protein
LAGASEAGGSEGGGIVSTVEPHPLAKIATPLQRATKAYVLTIDLLSTRRNKEYADDGSARTSLLFDDSARWSASLPDQPAHSSETTKVSPLPSRSSGQLRQTAGFTDEAGEATHVAVLRRPELLAEPRFIDEVAALVVRHLRGDATAPQRRSRAHSARDRAARRVHAPPRGELGRTLSMPIYSFRCDSCGNTFDIVEAIRAHDEHVSKHDLPCPHCGSTRLVQQLGILAVKTSKKS